MFRCFDFLSFSSSLYQCRRKLRTCPTVHWRRDTRFRLHPRQTLNSTRSNSITTMGTSTRSSAPNQVTRKSLLTSRGQLSPCSNRPPCRRAVQRHTTRFVSWNNLTRYDSLTNSLVWCSHVRRFHGIMPSRSTMLYNIFQNILYIILTLKYYSWNFS